MYEGSGERIDTRLSKQFSYSRSFFHHIISRWGVKVNGKVAKKSYQLKNNDDVEIDDVRRYLSPVILDEAPNISIPVILEKEDYLIINKPKWVLSHPKTVREIHEPSVVWFLYHTYKNLPTIWNFIRAGLLHRLDKNTDGLMIIAKTEKWLEHFKKLFQAKSESKDISDKEQTELKKFYRATSNITAEGKKFIAWMKEFPYIIQELVIAKLPHTISKIWITKIMEIVKKTDTTITFNLEILTGRTHQIRYHLSHHGLPIIGDYLYGNPDDKEPMQLTAYKLIFRDPENEIINIEI
jgi:23S rRNA pseudouridine1911/1915/1917 synthase